MDEEVSLYDSNAITSGELSDAEMTMLDNEATILDNGVPVDVKLDDLPEENPEDNNVEEVTPEEKPADTPKGDAQAQADNARQALSEVTTDLSSKGVDPDAIRSEWEANGSLSAESYAKLAEAGYSKAIVDSIIAGQQAAAEAVVRDITAYAGGPNGFAELAAFAQQHSPSTIDAYNAAIDRGDLGTVKALLDGLKAQRTAAFGSRNANIEARPTPHQAAKVQGFATQTEMIKAMQDSRYSRDPQYTKQVEAKVAASTFF